MRKIKPGIYNKWSIIDRNTLVFFCAPKNIKEVPNIKYVFVITAFWFHLRNTDYVSIGKVNSVFIVGVSMEKKTMAREIKKKIGSERERKRKITFCSKDSISGEKSMFIKT